MRKPKIGDIFQTPGFNYYQAHKQKLNAKRLPRVLKKKLKKKSKPNTYRIMWIEKTTPGMNIATLEPK